MGDEEERGNEIDIKTIFVRGLPHTLSDAQLEEVFSDVGPVRRAFTVKDKAKSDKHRGFGFVQFAIAEDAKRAVEAKNDTSVEGRKIKVELARKRPSLNERRKKKSGANEEGKIADADADADADAANKESEDADAKLNQDPIDDAKSNSKRRAKNKKPKLAKDQVPAQVTAASAAQRPARTVVIGNLGDNETAEAVLILAKKQGSVESIERNLSKEYLDVHGLSRDGCKLPAAAIVFTSVTAARQAVASYHLQKLGGEVFWARQLGGEGAKIKKWRLIVRNLPFKVTDAVLRESFSSAGFVWEVTVPRNPDGRSKGFAFIGYTCKNDAEKAIKTLNATAIANRTIAVDWAVAKATYESAVLKEEENEDSDRDNETASEADDDDDDEYEKEEGDEDDEDYDLEQDEEVDDDDDDDDQDEDEVDEEDQEEEEIAERGTLSERNLLRKVLDKVVIEPGKNKDDETVVDEQDRTPAKPSAAVAPKLPEENSMDRTLFIRNLPPDANLHDLKKRFSQFGEIRSFRLVLHPATKKPKGTAFVEFSTREAAEAVVRATKNAEEEKSSFWIAGKYPIAHFAVDRNAAKEMSTKKSIDERDSDKRNLYLLKEGLIEPGTAAANGVSKTDLLKRQALQNEKATKLRSPNFHVSRTRLAIHNFPKSLIEKEIKQMFINAVVSRASKQRPVIKQVKLLTDEKGNSRGSGFVEFTEHQHAIVALRVINNNPETFGPDKRPIVEFAIENIARLKKRESQIAAQKLRSKSRGDKVGNAGDQKPGQGNKRKAQTLTEEGGGQDDDQKQRKKAKTKNKRKNESKQGQVQDEQHPKPPGKRRKFDKPEHRAAELGLGDGDAAIAQGTKSGQGRTQGKTKAKRKIEKTEEAKSKMKPGETPREETKKRERKKSGKQEEEKLDRLVDEYRKKYFSNAAAKEGVKNLTRWYEQ